MRIALRLLRNRASSVHRGFSSSAAQDQNDFQTSLRKPVIRRGIGLHSGNEASVILFPSPAGKGRFFTLEEKSATQIPAFADFLVESKLSTCLGSNSVKVCTVEHLLAALEGLGVDNCRIHLEGGDEVPLLDGSAQQWVEAIDEAGISVARDESGRLLSRRRPVLKQPVHVCSEESFVEAFPSANLKITYGIDFRQHPAIGEQWLSYSPDSSTFRNKIAPARTFGLYEQIESLKAAGLVKGGCLENALVCSKKNGWLNPPLRFPDEPCRHKLLDLLGDLSLCSQAGNPGIPIAHITAYKASHALHAKFCKSLLEALQQSETHSHLGPPTETDSPRSLIDSIAYVPRRKKLDKKLMIPTPKSVELNTPLIDHTVAAINDIVYLEDLPHKLSAVTGKLTARDVAMVLKLVRDLRLAFGFFNWAKDQQQQSLTTFNLDVFLTMFHRLLVARKWEELNSVVDWMHENSFYLDFGLFEAVIKEASDAQQADVCEKWYRLMLEISVKPNVFIYNLMIRVYSRGGRNREALNIFYEMEENKVRPTVVTYSQLFSVCKDIGESKIAKHLLSKMRIQGIQPDHKAYTTLMNVYAKAALPDEAEGLFTAMKRSGIQPDVFLFNCLLESYVRAGKLDRATSVFKDRLLASGNRPNEATYVIMLGLFCKACLYDEAFDLLKTVDHHSVKLGEQFFVTLIKAFSEAGRWDDTITVFREMQKSSCKIRGSVYVLLLDVCFKAGYYDSCVEFFAAVLDKGINRTPGVYDTMIRAYDRMNNVAAVAEVFNYMQDMLCPFTSDAYDLLHGIFSRAKNYEMLEALENTKKAGKVIMSGVV